jgi:hypothetical protein
MIIRRNLFAPSEFMESDTKARSDTKQIVEIADLRTQLRTNLAAEFQQALCLATALTDEQRQALSKLVTDESATAQTILKCLTADKKAEPNE